MLAEVHSASATLLINEPYAASFWVFVIGIGIVIPLIILLLAVNHKIKHSPIAPILVIAGGLVLRFIIVEAGQYSIFALEAEYSDYVWDHLPATIMYWISQRLFWSSGLICYVFSHFI